MFTNHFGIEMEFTGITRKQAGGGGRKVSGRHHDTRRRLLRHLSRDRTGRTDLEIHVGRQYWLPEKKRTPHRSRRHKLQCRAGQPPFSCTGRHRHRTGAGTAFTQGGWFHQ